MVLSKKVREQMLALCGSLSDEDGLDPKDVYGKRQHQENRNQVYRQLRLCRQVSHTLSLVLPNAPLAAIRELSVQSVQPSASAARLIVRLCCSPAPNKLQEQLLREGLRVVEGWLRSEIAASISRRRVPTLAFEFVANEDDDHQREVPDED